ncbi:hypothetical protein Hanom_Chr17g01528431 [Helianthus anomalus]
MYPYPDCVLRDGPDYLGTTSVPHIAEDRQPNKCVRTNDVISVDHYKYPSKYKVKYDFLNLRPYFLSLISLSIKYLSSRRRVVAEGLSHLCGEPNGFFFAGLSPPLLQDLSCFYRLRP